MKTLKPRLGLLQASRVDTMQAGSWRTSRMTPSQRGYDSRWQRARAAYLRAHPLCVMCQAAGHVEPATVVDHIEPHRGDRQLFWDEANWQSLCAHCHSGEKQRQER